MGNCTVALFGEAERGEYSYGYYCRYLEELAELFGNPPEDSSGLYYATQIILYHHPLIFFRVEEEGFSKQDYLRGVKILESSPHLEHVKALCAPGVGDRSILNALFPFCHEEQRLFITNEKDLLDYLLYV
ncbi:MAG: hypothetical protein ACK5MA_07560 [Parachlamydiaceae bacterium]